MKYLLLILCVLLMGLIFYQVQYYQNIDAALNANSVSADIPDEYTDDGESRLKSIRAYSEIISRPLFSLDRKPPKIANREVATSINAEELEDLVLYGVVVSNETTYAIIRDDNSEKTEQFKKGRSYKGWKVSDITSESVKFEGDGAQYELFLTPNENTKKSGFKNNKKPTAKTIIPGYKSIYRSSQKKSPIKVPSASSSKKNKPVAPRYNKAELDELYEEGGYEFNADDELEIGEEDYDE